MGFLEWLGISARDAPAVTDSVRDSGQTFVFGKADSGERVDEKSAMQIATVYACVRLLAETVAGLPLHLYRFTDDAEKDKEFWNTIQFIFTAIGGWLGYFLGGCDGLLYTLLAFVVLDYLTGVMCAITDHKLSSHIGFKGIFRKVLIFALVGVGHLLDMQVLGSVGVLRTAVIFFYLSNEGVSLLENAAHLGLPIPERLKAVLEQLHDRAEKDGEEHE